MRSRRGTRASRASPGPRRSLRGTLPLPDRPAPAAAHVHTGLEVRGLLARAARIRLVLLDVDGVLTDGRIWYGPEGEALKAFDVRDGHGIVLLRDHIDFGVISGRPGRATERRLEELRFRHRIFAQRDKLAGYAKLAPFRIRDAEVAYMGDDVNDLPLLARVGLAACPADARPEVRAAVHFVTAARGGRGAVRELCDLILAAKGL